MPIKECPFCHSSAIKKIQADNDKYGDTYYCERCEHRFRYDEANVNQTIKEAKKHSDKWERLVEHLRREGKVDSPEAVATEQLGDESYV